MGKIEVIGTGKYCLQVFFEGPPGVNEAQACAFAVASTSFGVQFAQQILDVNVGKMTDEQVKAWRDAQKLASLGGQGQ